MAIGSYRYYRLLFTTAKYTTINEIGLYASNDGTGTNLLTGSTATASGSYGGTSPGAAIDGNATTYWESSTFAAMHWLSFDLGTAQSVKSLKITSTTYPNEVPLDFELQVSNDGATWKPIGFFVFGTLGTTHTDKVQALDLYVGGTSTITGGTATQKVLIYNWTTGALIGSTVPSADGAYEWRFENSGFDVMVTHIGPSGYRPTSDGPITPGT